MGIQIAHVKDSQGKDLNYLVVSTMMRIDLDQPMSTGDSYTKY